MLCLITYYNDFQQDSLILYDFMINLSNNLFKIYNIKYFIKNMLNTINSCSLILKCGREHNNTVINHVNISLLII